MIIIKRIREIEMPWKYVIVTYFLFGAMVLGICGTASMVFGASGITMRWLANLCAWSPTIVLLLMFKKLVPKTKVNEFIKCLFKGKLKARLFIISGISASGGILLSVFLLSIFENKGFTSYFNLGPYPIYLSFILSLLSGPTGEEAGWRGYLRNEFERKYGFLKGSIILGIVWAFWHTVLCFVDSDFSGINLLPYVISNVVVMISLTIIMNVTLKRSNNLIYPIWIHLCFNFMYVFLDVNIIFYVVLSIVYLLIATGYVIYYYKFQTISERGVA